MKETTKENPVATRAPHPIAQARNASNDAPLRHSRGEDPLLSTRLPPLDAPLRCEPFTSIDLLEKPFFPEIKAHTGLGQELLALSQSDIHFASKDYRLRSDHLAQTLRLFGHKIAKHLPEGFCVQVDLSPLEGTAACDTVTLIDFSLKGGAQAIMEQRYAPFNGGGIGWMVPTDEAKNTVLKLEERLFYYKTLLAIKTAVNNRISLMAAE